MFSPPPSKAPFALGVLGTRPHQPVSVVRTSAVTDLALSHSFLLLPLSRQGFTPPHIRLYAGPLPPSRGVQRGPITSVALQSTQLGAFTTSLPSCTS
jgi:hypothetical protein